MTTQTHESRPKAVKVPGVAAEQGDQTENAIPTEWQEAPQLVLDGFDIQAACESDRETYCRYLLGDLQARFRSIQKHATRIRDLCTADGEMGHNAMVSDAPGISDKGEARQYALEGLCNWFYRDGQDEKETVAYIGAIGCSAVTVGALKELNYEKAAFKRTLGELRDALHNGQPSSKTLYNIVSHIAPHALPNVERRYAGALVRKLIHQRLNIRQLVRQVPVVERPPATIRWRWVETPTTLKISRADLLQHLDERSDNPVSRMDFETIMATRDAFFCWRKGVSTDCRIFAKCSKEDEKGSNYVNFKSRVPVFYLEQRANSGHPMAPKMTVVPTETEVKVREKRVDPDPFLVTMPIHRYFDH
jgi:hypothetical protein